MTCVKCQHQTCKKFGYLGKRCIQRWRCQSCNSTFCEPHDKLSRNTLTSRPEVAALVIQVPCGRLFDPPQEAITFGASENCSMLSNTFFKTPPSQRPHQFPQFSTAQNADRVTNNLDRGFARAKTGRMYDGSPRRTTAIASATVSLKTDLLFRNTLGANTCGSIFYLSHAADRIRNSMKINTFGIAQGKVVEANTLFCNVLLASLSGSIFYGSSGDERATNSFKMNILQTSAKKLWRVPERRSKQKGRP